MFASRGDYGKWPVEACRNSRDIIAKRAFLVRDVTQPYHKKTEALSRLFRDGVLHIGFLAACSDIHVIRVLAFDLLLDRRGCLGRGF